MEYFLAGTAVGIIATIIYLYLKKPKGHKPRKTTEPDKRHPSRGLFYSPEFKCMVEDWRSDAEFEADANRQRR